MGTPSQIVKSQPQLVMQTGKLRDAQDQTLKLPAVGKEGRAAKDGPLQPFHSGLK